MAKRIGNRFNSVIIIIVCLISIVLVGSSFAMLVNYSRVMHEGAGVIGLINSDEAAGGFRVKSSPSRSAG